MARGRPRKTGKRYPGGKLKPIEVRAKTSYWQKQLEVLREGELDPYLGTPIGILLRRDVITHWAMDAAVRFAKERAAADAALGLPPRSARAQDMGAIRGTSDGVDSPQEVERKKRAVDAYVAAEMAVGLNSPALAALQWIVIYDKREDSYEQLLALFTGLDKLMKHYRISGTVRPQESEGRALAAQR